MFIRNWLIRILTMRHSAMRTGQRDVIIMLFTSGSGRKVQHQVMRNYTTLRMRLSARSYFYIYFYYTPKSHIACLLMLRA